jgi:hypothetical protein
MFDTCCFHLFVVHDCQHIAAASISQAVAVAQAVIATPGSHIYSIIAGMDIPVGALLGRPGAPSIREMDLSKVGDTCDPGCIS